MTGTRRLAEYVLLASMLLTSASAQQQAPKRGVDYAPADGTCKILAGAECDYKTSRLNMDGVGEGEQVTIFNHPWAPTLMEAYDKELRGRNNELFGHGAITVEVYNGMKRITHRVVRHKGIKTLEWRCNNNCEEKIGSTIESFLQRLRVVNRYSKKLENDVRAELENRLRFDAVFFHDDDMDRVYLLSYDPKGGVKLRDVKSLSGKKLRTVFIDGREL